MKLTELIKESAKPKLFEIKHRTTGAVLFSLEADSMKACVEAAVRNKVNLSHANLRNANLKGANLRDAKLRDADLSYAFMSNTDLTGADLTGADLTGVYVKNRKLK